MRRRSLASFPCDLQCGFWSCELRWERLGKGLQLIGGKKFQFIFCAGHFGRDRHIGVDCLEAQHLDLNLPLTVGKIVEVEDATFIGGDADGLRALRRGDGCAGNGEAAKCDLAEVLGRTGDRLHTEAQQHGDQQSCAPAPLCHPLTPATSQFCDGLSIGSMITTSTGLFCISSFRPSRSFSAVKSDGREDSACAGSSGVHSSVFVKRGAWAVRRGSRGTRP